MCICSCGWQCEFVVMFPSNFGDWTYRGREFYGYLLMEYFVHCDGLDSFSSRTIEI